VNQGGNTESDDTLVTAAIGGPQRVLAHASRHGQVDGSQLTGSWLGGLVGDGPFLGVSSWTTAGSPSIAHSALSRVRSSALSRMRRTPAWPRPPTAAAWPP
jgi:DMSO reductase anchor subunit